MKIIINADDFGFTQGTNDAIFELARLGTLTSTTVMTNMPYAKQARELLEIPNFSVGLHLNLTQGRPILSAKRVSSLVDAHGEFHDLKTFIPLAKKGRLKSDEVEAEIVAQWSALENIVGDKISHMDSHQGLNRIPFIFDRTLVFLKKQAVPAMRYYVKYYAVGSGDSAQIEKPGLRTVRRYGAKRLLVEAYLNHQRAKLLKHTKSPDGMLMPRSHDTLDVLNWLSKMSPPTTMSGTVVEIPCHPAANTDGLVDTKYVQHRVEEYEVLRSSAFVAASKRWSLVDYWSIG